MTSAEENTREEIISNCRQRGKKLEEKWAMLSAENTDTTDNSARRVKLSMIAEEFTMFPLIGQTT